MCCHNMRNLRYVKHGDVMNRCKVLILAVLMFSGNTQADTCIPPNLNGTYELVFSDEFDGDSLNRSKWNTQYLWGPGVIINNEQQYYVNEGQFGYNPFTVSDGVLTIAAIKAPFDRSQLYLTSDIYSATSAELLWRTPANATLYEVYKDGALIGTATGGSFYDTDLEEGFDAAYQVTALDASGSEIVTAQLTINTANREMPPPDPVPFSLNLRRHIYSRSSAELFWDPPNRAGRFEVYRDGVLYRSLDGSKYSSLYEQNLDEGEPHDYRVVAYDRCDDLIIEASIVLDTADGNTPREPPSTRLKLVDVVYSSSTAEIFWEPVAEANSFRIEENDVVVETTTARSIFVSGLVPGVDRRFTVYALDVDGNVIDTESRTLNTADNSFALNRQPYLSGVITSYDSFRFKYGKVEMRGRFPQGKGLWGAFWLLNGYYKQDQPEDPEIDIIEALGDSTTTARQAYHYMEDLDGDGFLTDTNTLELTTSMDDFSQEFHTYGVEWSEGLIVYFVDDVEVHRISGPQVSSEQMYLIANLAVGGIFPGPADETTEFPANYEIDYIRVWQLR